MVAVIEERLGVTSRQIEQRQRRFPWSLRGYRRSAVDQHIAELERELSELDHELIELRAAATLREEVATEMKRIGEETAKVLIEAHQQREAMLRAAEQEADRLLAEATARVRQLDTQREIAHQERDRVLETALAASAAIADLVRAAHQQIPPMAAREDPSLESAASSR